MEDEKTIRTFSDVILLNTKKEGKIEIKTIKSILVFWFIPNESTEKELFIKIQQIELSKIRKSMFKSQENIIQLITEIGMITNPTLRLQSHDELRDIIYVFHKRNYELEYIRTDKEWDECGNAHWQRGYTDRWS